MENAAKPVRNTARTPTRTPTRTQEQRNAIAKTKLCQAALELFALHDYDSVTLAEVGLRAGFSRGLAQYHFSTKAALVETLLDNMGQRDLQAKLLTLGTEASGADAWRQLLLHLDESVAHFSAMHGDDTNLAARGEMILCATAIFSRNTALRKKLNRISYGLLVRVRDTLQRCVRDGVIRPDIQVEKIAMFYVVSIWGVVNVLFANPDKKEYVSSMVDSLKLFMRSLRC